MNADHINPIQWDQAVGIARQACARLFRDGGSPGDALSAFGLAVADTKTNDWNRAVDAIAQHLCARPMLKAA